MAGLFFCCHSSLFISLSPGHFGLGGLCAERREVWRTDTVIVVQTLSTFTAAGSGIRQHFLVGACGS